MSNKPGTMTDFSDDWFYEYDLEKAAALLDEAGIKDTDGDGMREDADGNDFSITYLYIGTNNIYATIGEIMKNSLSSIGVTLELGGYDVSTYDDMMRNDAVSYTHLDVIYTFIDPRVKSRFSSGKRKEAKRREVIDNVEAGEEKPTGKA